jgi:hypothetical protein
LKKFIFILIILLSGTSFAQTGKLKGKVSDGSTAIPSVNIIILNTSFGTATKINGTYEISGIPTGNYEARFSAIGFESRTFNVEIEANKITELNVELKIKTIELQSVEITDLKIQDQRDTRTSLIDLDPRDAKILAGAAEDVFRTLQSLPGVLAPNDFSSQLIVRGSGPDQNLIILDDVEVFNPYRLYGVVSMFNPDAVQDVNLISGGFPAKYGDRLSAVLDVTNREGTISKNLGGMVNISIVDANLVLEGKNPFNFRGSWLFNTRRTYYDLIIEPFVKNAGLVDDNTSFPNFYDLQAKLVIGPYNGHKFLFNGILSRDAVNIVSGKERNTPDSIGVYNITNNDLASAAWHFAPNKNILNKVIVSWYKNNGTTDFDSQILDPSLNRSAFENTIPDTLAPYLLQFSFGGEFIYKKYSVDDKFTYLLKDHIFEAGVGADFMQTTIDFRFDLDEQLQAVLNSNPQFRSAIDDLKDIQNFNRYRAYLQDNFRISEKLTFQPGLRLDYYNILTKAYLAPRISMSYAFDQLTTLRAVWGLYYQSPGYEKLRDQGVLYDLSDRYTETLVAEKAAHYVFGIERWLSGEWSARVEAYYKDFDNLYLPQKLQGDRFYTEPIPGKDPRYASGWTLPATFSGDSLTQIPINASFGEAYGFEFFLSKRNTFYESRFSGWVSYAIAYANRYEDGLKYPFNFDQRHTVNIVLNYQMNNWLEFGVRWQYGSGFPISQPSGVKPRIILVDQDLDGTPETPVIATRKLNNGGDNPVIFDVDFADRKLNSRKPVYHRLDFRVNAFAHWWDLDWTIYLDIINLYNRSNVIGYDYYVTEDLQLARETTTMLPIIPTLGFSVRF